MNVLWNQYINASYRYKTSAMTNTEILQSDYLDIVFENRNKAYGAYALRRNYESRLLTALLAGLTLLGVVVLFSSFKKHRATAVNYYKKGDSVVITSVILPPDKPRDEIKPLAKHPAAPQKIGSVRDVNIIKIRPDDVVKNVVPLNADINNKLISDHYNPGDKDNGIPQRSTTNDAGNTGSTKTGDDNINTIDIIEKEPEFPGGQAALIIFLKEHLRTPESLEAGEAKTVKIKFKVESDGSVDKWEIVQSGGKEFDEEVLRVSKLMPHWIPAVQNGVKVPVSFIVPVTFVGVEQ